MKPGRLFLGPALFWLAAGLLLNGAAAAALAWPFSGRETALALARFGPAGDLALRFGWASLAGAGFGLAILGALPSRLLWSAAVLWNGSLFIGIGGLLLGREIGGWQIGLAGAALLLGLGAWRGPLRTGSIAESYALAAFAALPFCLCGSEALRFFAPESGMAAVVGRAWITGAFFGLWLAPLALAILYDGKAIPHAGIAAFGFLVQIGAAEWTGTARLVGGPVPLWIGSVGTAASLLMLLPALAVPLSLAEVRLPGRLAASLGAYVLFLVQGAWLSWSSSNAWHLTLCDAAQADLGLFGFVTIAFMARLSPAAAWCGLSGVLVLLGAEEMGGWLQAFAQTDPHVPWAALTDLLHPFLALRALGYLLMLAALFLHTGSRSNP